VVIVKELRRLKDSGVGKKKKTIELGYVSG
jgi:hypothetical protein